MLFKLYRTPIIINKTQSSGEVLNSLAEIKAKQQKQFDKVKVMFRDTNENIESGIANAKHLRISIDEPHVLISFVIMSVAIAVLSVALHLAKRPDYDRIDNDLKYRYIKMKGDASAEQIATLEDIFELNRDNQRLIRCVKMWRPTKRQSANKLPLPSKQGSKSKLQRNRRAKPSPLRRSKNSQRITQTKNQNREPMASIKVKFRPSITDFRAELE